jgi:UDP-N-acetyl-2-amino-2-deoxyglucuronate dehydrogenase
VVRYGIVGCGHIAKKHVDAIAATDGAELVAVCDTNPDRMAPIAREGIRGYTDLEQMLKDSPVDVVSICTPSGLHAELAIRAAEAGKHLVVEKPMAMTLDEADRMIDACEKNGVLMTVVHPNRFRPAVIELKRRMEEGAFGTIGHANATVRWNRNQSYYDQAPWRGTRSMDGGVLMNQAIHNLDLLLWLMGDVEEVASYQATRIRRIEAEDTSVSVLRFKSGALGVIEAAVTVYPRNLEESLAIFGEKGTAVIGGPTANWVKTWRFADLTEEEAQATIARVEEDPYGVPGHQCIIEDMTEAIRTGRQPKITGEDGRRALGLAVACNRAAADGRPVRLDSLRSSFPKKAGGNHR